MRSQLHHQDDNHGAGAATSQSRAQAQDYPVRDYVAAMAGELARMARWDGDERLACLLEAAADVASRPCSTDKPALE
ncbi:hypothetical protein [Brevundimonas sp. PAMC22021]|uniref:hypothetical protein n=1 Tax=Brevundimonas sp. PAMC22021 TaxID=2861285 RepID=UPI001C62F8DA|nr:hypothetical protein [Brevundimonas sp. PAMC22021]QYF88176.1 hypothetical protein KY493_06865 [Brevundimonas sp. PAMC22021]